jgi:hypothetical protein
LLAFLVAAAALAACSSGSAVGPAVSSPTARTRPSSSGTLSIVSPKQGETVKGGSVLLELGLTGARIVPLTTSNLKPNEGHVHVLLDGRLVTMTSSLEERIPNVPAGAHVVRAEFVASDHAPFNPRVVAEVSFTSLA